MPDNLKLTAALDMARRGYAVFPLVPNSKTPAVANWQNLATTDRQQIERWWDQWPDANIGHPTVNEIVIDVDPRKGGRETFSALTLTEDFPRTAVVETQSKGNHIVYALPGHIAVKGGTDLLGRGVDVKSWGGYVVAPGSTVDGRPYARINEKAPAPAPQWLIDRCNARRQKSSVAGERLVAEDDEAVRLAQQWLDQHAPDAKEGERDDTAFKVAARLYDFGVSPQTAQQMLTEWSETRAYPPLAPEDVARVADSASKNRSSAIGSRHPSAAGFEPIETFSPATPHSLASEWIPQDVSKLPPRDWVIPDMCCRQNVGMLAGPAGVSKSTYALALAVAAITGRSDIAGVPIRKQSSVWIWNQEDDMAELQRRLAAVKETFDVKDEDIAGRLYLNSGVDSPLVIARRTVEHTIVRTPHIDACIADIRGKQIGLVIFDPLVEFHQGEENDNVQMRTVLGIVREIAVKANCAVMLCAHTRKPDAASSRGFAGEMDSVRGASSQIGVLRTLFTLNTASPADVKKWAMEESHLAYVRLDMAKNNLARMWTEPKWYKRASATVGGPDGESVGVLRPVELSARVAIVNAPDRVAALAAALAAHFNRGQWVAAKDVVAAMPKEASAGFGSPKNLARTVKAAFQNTTKQLTECGTLILQEDGCMVRLEPMLTLRNDEE